MKSSWNFIGRFLSRKDAAANLDEDSVDGTKAETIVSSAELPESSSGAVASIDAPTPAATKIERDSDEKKIPGSTPILAAADEVEMSRPRLDLAGRGARTSRNKRSANIAPSQKQQSSQPISASQARWTKPGRPVQAARPMNPPHVDFRAMVEETDADVQRLRRDLAIALVQQNAQLRKMLERFGVS